MDLGCSCRRVSSYPGDVRHAGQSLAEMAVLLATMLYRPGHCEAILAQGSE